MSHIVQVKLKLHSKDILNSIDNQLSKLSCLSIEEDNLSKVQNEIKNNLIKLQKEINNRVVTNNPKAIAKEKLIYQKELDNSMKRITNIVIASEHLNIEKETTEFLMENGLMGSEALKNLKDNNQESTLENLKKEVDRIRIKELDSKEKNNITDKIEKLIEETSLTEEIKDQLIKKMDTLNTIQELTDFSYLVSVREENYEVMKSKIKNVFDKQLQKLSFRPLMSKMILNEKAELEMFVKYRKAGFRNEEITLSINSSLNTEWQMGNYHDHLCEDDSMKFLESLENDDEVVSEYTISRNVSHDLPNSKEAIFKESGK